MLMTRCQLGMVLLGVYGNSANVFFSIYMLRTLKFTEFFGKLNTCTMIVVTSQRQALRSGSM